MYFFPIASCRMFNVCVLQDFNPWCMKICCTCHSSAQEVKAQIAVLLPCFLPQHYDIFLLFLNNFPLVPHPSLHPAHPPPLPVHVLSLLCLLSCPAWRRGPVGGEHEWGVFGGGGEIVAGERPECDPGRLLETQRLFTSLEGTHDWHVAIFNETPLTFSTRVKVNVFTGGSWSIIMGFKCPTKIDFRLYSTCVIQKWKLWNLW